MDGQGAGLASVPDAVLLYPEPDPVAEREWQRRLTGALEGGRLGARPAHLVARDNVRAGHERLFVQYGRRAVLAEARRRCEASSSFHRDWPNAWCSRCGTGARSGG